MTPLSDRQVAERLRAEARSLVGFVLMLTGDREVADDVYQETCLEAWRVRGRFRAGGDFGAWLRGIARHVVLRQRRSFARSRLTPFDAEVMEQLSETWSRQRTDEPAVQRRAALEACLDALDQEQRGLLRRRYNDHVSHEELARDTGRSADAVKMTLHRLRRKLSDCVTRRLREAEREGVDAI